MSSCSSSVGKTCFRFHRSSSNSPALMFSSETLEESAGPCGLLGCGSLTSSWLRYTRNAVNVDHGREGGARQTRTGVPDATCRRPRRPPERNRNRKSIGPGCGNCRHAFPSKNMIRRCLVAVASTPMLALANYGSVCERTETLATAKNPSGGIESATCVSQCTPGTYTCPNMPDSSVSGRPACALQGADLVSFYCALACNTDANCPSGGSCKQIARAPASAKMLGICITPASGDGSTPRVDVGAGFPPLPHLENIWDQIATKPQGQGQIATGGGSSSGATSAAAGQEALKLLARTYSIPASDPALTQVQAALVAAGGGASGSGLGLAPLDGNWVDDLKHDVRYVEKHILDGDLLTKELHDTYWNVTHLESSGAYAILHGLSVLIFFYCLLGACLKHYVTKAEGWDMVPHKEFWQDYPNLVVDGAHIVSNFVKMEMLSRGGPQGGGPPSSMMEGGYNQHHYVPAGAGTIGGSGGGFSGGAGGNAGFGTGML